VIKLFHKGDGILKTLTDTFTINNMQLRNRLVMPALTNNCAAPGGLLTEDLFDFYRSRSAAVGLVIVEAAAVRSDGCLVPNSPGLWNDNQVPGMEKLAALIKSAGASAAVQLNHAGARCVPQEGSLVGASPSGFQFRSDIAAVILTEAQIKELVDDFASAAGRAVNAGFDAVEIHGAHFYLLSQFISPYSNQRTDSYGGDIQGRAKFPLEVVRAVRNKIGPGHTIIFRLNAVEQVLGQEVSADTRAFSRMLADAGVDLLDVSYTGPAIRQEIDGGAWQVVMSSALSRGDQPGANIMHAKVLKEASGIPVITVGKMGNQSAIEAALEDDHTDLIAIGRQIIADPDSAGKILAGRFSEIKYCKECFNCFSSIRKGTKMKCALWP